MRRWAVGVHAIIGLAIGLAVASATHAAEADSTRQAPAPTGPARFMVRGHPLPECSSFPIIEFGVIKPMGANAVARGDEEAAVTGDYGYMVNVGPEEAWGGTFHFEAGSFRSRAGLAVRRRAWASRNQAFDLQLGVLLAGSEHSPHAFASPGFLAGVKYSLGDLLVLDLHGETRSIKEEVAPNTREYGPADRTVVVHAGAQLGSGLGAAATGAGAVIAAVGVLALFAALGGG